jgi:hypothetical protein
MPTGLTPVITYLGASIRHAGDSEQTDNPLTDAPRDFSNSEDTPVPYTVTAGDVEQQYEVIVTFEQQNLGLSVSFLEITDPGLITESFDQSTGLLTLTINDDTSTLWNPGGYEPPYVWRLDGVKLNASSTANIFTLNVNDYGPGQYELTLVTVGADDHQPYTNKIKFMVHG